MDRSTVVYGSVLCSVLGIAVLAWAGVLEGSILSGMTAGILSGAMPGFHINVVVSLVGMVVAGSAAFFGALAGGHMLSQLVVGMLLAAPSEGVALSVLPAQRLLAKGEGDAAVLAGLAGCVFGTLCSLAFMPAAMVVLPFVYEAVYPRMGWLLLGLNIYMVGSERRKGPALLVFLLSGALGILVLGSPLPESANLFSLLTGCFGVSALAMGLASGHGVRPQKMGRAVDDTALPGGMLGVLAGFLVGTFPAVSASQAVALLSPLLHSDAGFIAAVSSASASSIIFSALTLASLGRARSGLMVAVGELGGASVYAFIGSLLVAVLPACLFALACTSGVLRALVRWYRPALLCVLSVLVVLSLVFGGVWGVVVLFVSACLGALAAVLGVRRTQCMGMLILPTILFYFGYG